MADGVSSDKKLSAENLWLKVLDEIKTKVSAQTFSMWFEPTIGSSLSQNILCIKAPNPFFAEWIEEHYHILLDEAITYVNGTKLKRSYKYEEPPRLTAGGQKEQGKFYVPDSTQLLQRYTFDTFVVGENNKFANAAAVAVAKGPGKVYNPLFLYGSVGLGKTHLLEAIGNYVKEHFANLKIYYTPCESVMNEMVDAIQTNKSIQFRNKYRRKDVLLIDDIEFLEGKEGLQEETFHIMNSLYDSGKQCVFTSDRPPSALVNLQERIVSRLRGGLICDIKKPSLETRVAILKNKAEKSGISVPDDVIFFIAEQMKTSIRELEGALIKLFALASLAGEKINIETAKNILKDMSPLKKEITVDYIQKVVAEYYNVSPASIRGKRRLQSIVKPRNIAMFLAREYTNLSLVDIGKFFGNRDHATVIHSYNQINSLLEKNIIIKQEVDNILKLITCE